MLLQNHPELRKKYFRRIAKVYICIDLVNIRNSYVKHSHCGPFPHKSTQ